MGDPHRHDHNHLPIVLAGGRWRGGRGIQHLRFADKKSLLSVHSSLLAGVGRQVNAGRGEDTVLEPVADLDLRWQSV